MDKKVLMPIMALLVLFAVAPVMAAPAERIPYTANVDLTIVNLGEEWVTGMRAHVTGRTAQGPFVTTTGPSISGIMWKEFDFTVNLNTGKGTIRGKFVLTVGVSTLEGSFRGIITDETELAGTVVGHGTGDFEGVKTRGTWEGEIIDGTTIENTLDAIIISPKGPL